MSSETEYNGDWDRMRTPSVRNSLGEPPSIGCNEPSTPMQSQEISDCIVRALVKKGSMTNADYHLAGAAPTVPYAILPGAKTTLLPL